MLKPTGAPVGNMDRVMLLNLWARQLDRELAQPAMIFAGMGKPSYLLNEDIAIAAARYWQQYVTTVLQVKQSMAEQVLHVSLEQRCDKVAQASTAIDYGNPAGEYETRFVMAQAFSQWYETAIDPDDIIFTIGGAGSLRMLFRFVNSKLPGGRIITPFPYYSNYYNPDHHNNLHCIDVLQEPGYRLTAQAVKRSIDEVNILAEVDKKGISAFLFCDPNNPLGSVVGADEWGKIAAVLETTASDIPIIIDEAYAEMVFDAKHISLLTVAPQLKKRLIILRSATKGFSASGERMAVMVCSDPVWRDALLNEAVLSYVHLPKSLQYAYSQAMIHFTDEKRQALSNYYRLQVEFVQENLKELGIQLPDLGYKVEGTFYVLADLSALLGAPVAHDAARALGKVGVITTDEELCYTLLFEDRIMIAPLSYFGIDSHKGWVRITCCAGISGLSELMERIKSRLQKKRNSETL